MSVVNLMKPGRMLVCVFAILAATSAAAGEPPNASASLQARSTEGGRDPQPASLELIARGKDLYERRCGACHSLDHNRIGPRHRDVYGRKAGSVPDFRYSKALQSLDVVWTEETLNAWLENPTALAPGTAMGFRLTDAEERSAVIAFLKSLRDSKP